MKIWLILLAPLFLGATIHGTIYDLDLSIQEDSIVSITTQPPQTFVAKDGSYSFAVPPGTYHISARFEDYAAQEDVSVTQEGSYVIDLILAPQEEGMTLSKPWPLWPVFMLSTMVLAIAGIMSLRKKPSMHEDLQPLLDFLSQHEGRASQTEIVKAFPVSEAKISLMLSELEHLGKIHKIKKGRTNVIILA